MIEFIVNNGADINACTNDGRSVYNIAEENGNKDALGLILNLGGKADPQKFPELKGPYLGQVPPENEAIRFAPGIVFLDHGTITISPDGKEIYWGTGTSIMMTKIQDDKWTKPTYASFSGQSDISFYDDVPFITPDNKKLFFTSKRKISPGIKNLAILVTLTQNSAVIAINTSKDCNGFFSLLFFRRGQKRNGRNANKAGPRFILAKGRDIVNVQGSLRKSTMELTGVPVCSAKSLSIPGVPEK